ncbi:MAG TPA: lysylphosphatidylglycerol synthase domain-containing protein [Kamptonema sp.]|nr:lysylphosphatidylglycerol synthase domain-containing protein [Kamptonema sp.]
MVQQIFQRITNLIKPVGSRFKPYLRYFILGGTLLFVAKAFKEHWQEVAAIRIDAAGVVMLAIALGVTLLSHIWAGWVWLWILREFNQSVDTAWGIRVFLKTNIGKYLPGNIWHFWGRIQATRDRGVPTAIATLSVLLEPLLMAAAALLIALMGSLPGNRILQLFSLAAILMSVHPKILNTLVKYVGKLKGLGSKIEEADSANINHKHNQFIIKRYPLLPLLGEIGFLGLRGGGFLLTLMALAPINFSEIPQLLSAFSLAYVLGLVIPGAPGGLGVFEATAIALLDRRFSPALIVSAVAFYRLISILAEAIGAGLAWLYKSNSDR